MHVFASDQENEKKKSSYLLIKQCIFKMSLPMKAEGKRYEIVKNTVLL